MTQGRTPAEAPLGSRAPVLTGSWVRRSGVGLMCRSDLPCGHGCSLSEPSCWGSAGQLRMEVTLLPCRHRKTRQALIPAARQRGALAHLPHSFPQQDQPPGPRAAHRQEALGLPEDPRQSLSWAERARRTGQLVSPSQAALNKRHKPDVFQGEGRRQKLCGAALQEHRGALSPAPAALVRPDGPQDEFKEIPVRLRTLGCFLTR